MNVVSEVPEFVIEREFDAPPELVWRAWTEPELLARWYGPNVETVVHEFDLSPGGLWLHEMKMGDNSHYVRIEFQEIVPRERISWRESGADAEWKPTIKRGQSTIWYRWGQAEAKQLSFAPDEQETIATHYQQGA